MNVTGQVRQNRYHLHVSSFVLAASSSVIAALWPLSAIQGPIGKNQSPSLRPVGAACAEYLNSPE